MNHITKVCAAIFILAAQNPVSAQKTIEPEKKIYTDSTDKVYVNMEVPIYLSISANPDGSDGTVLKGQDPKYSYPMYLDTEGYNSIRSPWKVDPVTKKVIYPKDDVLFAVYADGTAPKTTISYGGDQRITSEEIVTINGKEISLSAKDNLSGVTTIYTSINTGAYQEYGGPIALTEGKIYNIKYYAVDNVGNAAEVKSISVRSDVSAPISAISAEGDQSERTLSARTTLKIAGEDSGAGIAKSFYSIDQGKTYTYSQPIRLTNLAEGEHTITYFSSDKVGNKEMEKSYTFFLDKSAPRVISEVVGNTFIANGKEYYSGKTKLKLVALDNKAGVQEIKYSVNGGEYAVYDSPFLLSEPGDLDIDVVSIDKVNNKKTIERISDNAKNRSYVDLSGPELTYKFDGPAFVIADTTYLNKKSKITLRGTDAESGFKEIDYQLNGGSLNTYDEPFSIEKEGFYNITFNGYDNLSNSNTNNAIVRIDNSGPEVFHRFSIKSNHSKTVDEEQLEVFPPHVAVFLSATDRFAGLGKITYQINGGPDLAYNGLIESFKKNTKYTITVNVADKLGNKNSKDITFYVE